MSPPPLLAAADELSPPELDDAGEDADDESLEEAEDDADEESVDDEVEVELDDGAVDELVPQAARARPPTRVTAANLMDFFTSTSMLFAGETGRNDGRQRETAGT